MDNLQSDPNLEDADGFYAALLAAHDGLDADQTAALNARLILILANHIGDGSVLRQAIDAARATMRSGAEGRLDTDET